MKFITRLLGVALTGVALQVTTFSSAFAQMETGPITEKKYGQGLPRDHRTLLFPDSQYPTFPLKAHQKAYADISGARMKQDIIALSQINLKHRGTDQWWGRFPGTPADVEGSQYMLSEFKRLGLQTYSVPYTLPHDWRAESFEASYNAGDGKRIVLTTIFPAADTKETPPEGITAEAIWVGVGDRADFAGRDVKGKAVIIYSVFVPGGRSHSASDRAGLFNANTIAAQKGAALIINVMAVPGNGQFQPEGGNRDVTHLTLSQDEGFALRDRLAAGERITIHAKLKAKHLTNIKTAYHWAVLPGQSDEQVMIMAHTDGFFQAATDNGGGMASALELARHFAGRAQHQRPRTLVFLLFPDHHHGEFARTLINPTYNWNKVALKLTLEHPSETNLVMYNEDLTPTNNMSATRWNAMGSVEFERMCVEMLSDFGNAIYVTENGPKNGAFAPSFHTINHVIYHTSLDAPELVPAEGQQRATRAFAAIIDKVNQMTIAQVRGPRWPLTGTGTINGGILP